MFVLWLYVEVPRTLALHHFLRISLDEKQSIMGHILLLYEKCTLIVCTNWHDVQAELVYTKLSYSLLTQIKVAEYWSHTHNYCIYSKFTYAHYNFHLKQL